jgi:hypothetical protein
VWRPPCQLTTLAVKPAGTVWPAIDTRTVAAAALAVVLALPPALHPRTVPGAPAGCLPAQRRFSSPCSH